jgi:hypothetical protein
VKDIDVLTPKMVTRVKEEINLYNNFYTEQEFLTKNQSKWSIVFDTQNSGGVVGKDLYDCVIELYEGKATNNAQYFSLNGNDRWNDILVRLNGNSNYVVENTAYLNPFDNIIPAKQNYFNHFQGDDWDLNKKLSQTVNQVDFNRSISYGRGEVPALTFNTTSDDDSFINNIEPAVSSRKKYILKYNDLIKD